MGLRHQVGRLLSQRISKLRRTSRAKHHSFRPALEALEQRALMAGFWQSLNPANPTAGPAGTSNTQAVMLLSNGEVMVQNGSQQGGATDLNATRTWYRLTPNAAGSYVTGTWGSQSQMNVPRVNAPTAMLQDARVITIGGEFSLPNDFTNTTEIYDPVTNVWTPRAPVPTPATTMASNSTPSNAPLFPTSQFGNSPIAVLPSGQILAGYFDGPQTFIYNPSTNTWATADAKERLDSSDGESWAKLPDGSILSVNINEGFTATEFHAQRYVPETGTWVDASLLDASVVIADMPEGVGGHMGPLVTLPDGRAIQFGADGDTAFYRSASNTWFPGPSLPSVALGNPPVLTQLGALDGPAAVLPNGKVLVALSPTTPAPTATTTPAPTFIFEFDPNTNTFTDVTPSNVADTGAFALTMLVLPTGQVLMSDQQGPIQIYTPDGAPLEASRPTIQGITSNNNGTFTLFGTQLNGLTEGATYGDDYAMASNYPIIRLVDKNNNVSFARTFNWSSTGIQTGPVRQSVNFTLPGGRSLSDFKTFTVIANGIPSVAFQNSTLPGQISGVKYDDRNQNGMREPGEPGIAHVTIFVDLNNDGKLSIVEPAAVTDNFGRYTIKNLPPRVDYVLREMPAPDPTTGLVATGGRQTEPGALGVNFGAGPRPLIPFVYTNVIVNAGVGAVLNFGNDLRNANDFGDAPDSYGTTLAANGARHGNLVGFRLGLQQDGEPDGQPTANATGDDVNPAGTDDEDGIIFATGLTPGLPATVAVTVSLGGNSAGKLHGWIDFNQNGKFDASERVIANRSLNGGTTNVQISVPANAKLGPTFARFRYGYESDLAPTGASIVGEVEDYQVTVLPSTPIANPDVFPRQIDIDQQGLIKPNSVNYRLDVLANDTPTAFGQPQIVAGSFPSVLPGTGSTLSLGFDITVGRQVLVYTAGPGVVGGSQEIFTYRVTDGNSISDPGQVTLNISLADNIAIDDTFTLAASGSPINTLLDAMENDLTPFPQPTARIIDVQWIQQAGEAQQGNMSIDGADPTLLRFQELTGTFRGTEIYQYTIDDNLPGDPDNGTAPSTRFVTVQVVDPEILASPPGTFDANLRAANYLAELDVTIVNSVGVPISVVTVGDEFFLKIISHDLRPGGSTADRGVESVYLDLLFDRDLIAPVPDPDSSNPMQAITFDPLYSLDPSGQNGVNNAPSADEINEAGAFHDSVSGEGVGPGFVNVFMVRMQAKAATGGTPIQVRGDPRDEDNTDVTIMPSTELTNNQVFHRPSNTLSILGGGEGEFVNFNNPLDVNEDEAVSPVDALIVINTLNAEGSFSLRGMSSVSSYAMIDTNMDSMLSPADALVVINGLNRLGGWLASSGAGGEGEGEGESEISTDMDMSLLLSMEDGSSSDSSLANADLNPALLMASETPSSIFDEPRPAADSDDETESCSGKTEEVDTSAADDLYASLGLETHLKGRGWGS